MTPSFVASGPRGIHQGKRMILHSGLWARTCFTNAATASGNSGASVPPRLNCQASMIT